ncbi:Stk1 family PASTA domain-containing Ser/Thr kinase [uncultured Corynebacterium sp.]|uniref:Stk1 family PASTA domain-containing Ser/Thr kinase n=1 Tax=uncultured Corynebacterium sp. TaxID=159447 RepID=UPI0025968938|nr:Stk1 family PASTA domain-containing Ser/Thr kinase [uncultured Corynebacterium sp.]
MDRRGTLLGGRYRLDAKIGTGGMSDVYAATDELLTRDVAVKMMRPDLARDTSFLERFRREAQNAAKLNQPNIVAVYDTGETPPNDGSVPYIVMERVHGETLRDILQEHGKMSLNDAAKIMSQVAEALHFSHEAGIIHRDIKPANIMITNTGAVKVMDFGIARALSDSSAAITQTAAVIGTAQYLSPEQARGKSADSRSDIYALGCVFYELATGRPPFEGESPFSVAFQHVKDDPKPPSTVQGMHLSHREALSLDSIILTAMAKKPEDRYDDSQQLAIDLRRLSEDQLPLVAQAYSSDTEDPATSVIPAAPQRLPEEYADDDFAGGSRHRAGFAPAGAAAGAGMGAGMAAGAGALPANQQNYPEEYDEDYYEDGEDHYEDQQRSRWVPILWTVLILALLGGGGWLAYNFLTPADEEQPQVQQETRISVPDVANLSREDAENALQKVGLPFDVTERTHESIPRGSAITTEPAPGSSVPSGTRVSLVLSSGKEITDVPDLTGMTTAEARGALEQAGLSLNSSVKEEPSDDAPSGSVITQSPAQGSQVSKGTKVSITVSTGPENIRVPIVTGQQEADARSNLESSGFTVIVQRVDSTEPEGLVISSSNEGEQLPKGSEITLQVSQGNLFQMPTLQGKDYGSALRLLQEAGWRGTPADLTRKDVNTPDLARVDEIAQQSVHAGQKIPRDTRITVDVYRFSLLP